MESSGVHWSPYGLWGGEKSIEVGCKGKSVCGDQSDNMGINVDIDHSKEGMVIGDDCTAKLTTTTTTTTTTTIATVAAAAATVAAAAETE